MNTEEIEAVRTMLRKYGLTPLQILEFFDQYGDLSFDQIMPHVMKFKGKKPAAEKPTKKPTPPDVVRALPGRPPLAGDVDGSPPSRKRVKQEGGKDPHWAGGSVEIVEQYGNFNVVRANKGRTVLLSYTGPNPGLAELESPEFKAECMKAVEYVAQKYNINKNTSTMAIRSQAEVIVETKDKDGRAIEIETVRDIGTTSKISNLDEKGKISRKNSRLNANGLDHHIAKVVGFGNVSDSSDPADSEGMISIVEVQNFAIEINVISPTRGGSYIPYYNAACINTKVESGDYCGLVALSQFAREKDAADRYITWKPDNMKSLIREISMLTKGDAPKRITKPTVAFLGAFKICENEDWVNFENMSLEDIEHLERLNNMSITVLSHKYDPDIDVKGARKQLQTEYLETEEDEFEFRDLETSSVSSTMSEASAHSKSRKPKGLNLRTYDLEYPGAACDENTRKLTLLRVYEESIDARSHWVYVSNVDQLMGATKGLRYCPFCHGNVEESHECSGLGTNYNYKAASIKFRAHAKRLPPYILVADFETAPRSQEDKSQEVYAWGLAAVKILEWEPADENRVECFQGYGPNSVESFLDCLSEVSDKVYQDSNKFPDIDKRERALFIDSYPGPDKCYLCYVPNTRENLVVDHCHCTGEILGWACKSCNTKRTVYGSRGTKIPLYFHNGSKFDFKFLISNLFKRVSDPRQINILGDHNRVVSITWERIAMLDSLSFLGKSLKLIMENLKETPCLDAFGLEHTKGEMDHDKVFIDSLPDEIPPEWQNYLMRDVLGLADAMRTFALTCFDDLGANPCSSLSMPSYAWNLHLSELAKTRVKFEAIDADSHGLLKSMLTGGYCSANFRYVQKTKGENRIFSIDQTSQYPYIMANQALPVSNPKWEVVDEFNSDEIRGDFISENKTHFFMVDMYAPPESHDWLRDFPGLCEYKSPSLDMLSPQQLAEKKGVSPIIPQSLISDLTPKTDFVEVGHVLSLMIAQGWRCSKIHAIGRVKCVQKAGIVDKLISLRRTAKAEGDVNKAEVYKIAANSIYGKSCYDPAKYGRVQFRPLDTIGPNYFANKNVLFCTLSKDLSYNIVYRNPDNAITYDSPLYYGVYVAAMGRWHVLNQWYNVVKRADPNARLIHTATDSLTIMTTMKDPEWNQFKTRYADVPGKFKLVDDEIERCIFLGSKQYILDTPNLPANRDRFLKMAGLNPDDRAGLSAEDIANIVVGDGAKVIPTKRLMTRLGTADGVHMSKRNISVRKTMWYKSFTDGFEMYPFGHYKINELRQKQGQTMI